MLSHLLPGWSSACAWESPRPESSEAAGLARAAYSALMPLVVVAGLAGNTLTLAVLRDLRVAGSSPAYSYLTALALADLCVMLGVLPLVARLAGLEVPPRWSHVAAAYHAHVELPLVSSCMAASVFLVVCLTAHRYVAVCAPASLRSAPHAQRTAKLAILACWLLAIVVSCPLSALKTVCTVKFQNATSSGDGDGEEEDRFSFQENVAVTSSVPWQVYLWSSETLVHMGPALVLGVLNALIIRRFRQLSLRRRRFRAASDKFRARHLLDPASKVAAAAAAATQREGANGGGGRGGRSYREERRLVVLLTAIVVLFFVTMTPTVLLSLWYSERRDNDPGFQLFRAAANNLELANFALNFYAYFLCSREFRRGFLNMLRSRCCGGQGGGGAPGAAHVAADAEEAGGGGGALDSADVVDMEDFSRNGTTVRQSPEAPRSPDKPQTPT